MNKLALLGVGLIAGFGIMWYRARYATPDFPPIPPPPLGKTSVRVKALDTETSLPVIGASVTLNGYVATTNYEGIADFQVPAGSYTIEVIATGYLPSPPFDVAVGDYEIRRIVYIYPVYAPPPPPPPPPSEVFTIGFYYIWHYTDDYDADWLQNIEPSLALALQRFGDFMATNDYPKEITYEALGEFKSTADIGHGRGMYEDYDHDQAIIAVDEVCHSPGFAVDFETYDLIYLLFANTHDCFGPVTRPTDASGTRRTPIYIGDMTFFVEADERYCIIEHELFVVFGVPELWEDPGVPTLMYDPMLTEIILTEQEKQLAKWANFQKGEIGIDF